MTRRHDPAWTRRWRRRAPSDEIMGELSRAMVADDERAIAELLHRAVVLVVDSGGHLETASIPLTSPTTAASALLSLMTTGAAVMVRSINGVAGITLLRDDRVVGILTAEVRSGRLFRIWVVCNPEKLRHWNR